MGFESAKEIEIAKSFEQACTAERRVSRLLHAFKRPLPELSRFVPGCQGNCVIAGPEQVVDRPFRMSAGSPVIGNDGATDLEFT